MSEELIFEKDTPQIQAARKTKTLYVREEDQTIWDQAREIVGDSLSAYVTNHLRTLVASRNAALLGFERIVVRFISQSVPSIKAFYGRWLISPYAPYSFVNNPYDDEEAADCFAVAITSKNNFVVFRFWGSSSSDEEADKEGREDYFPSGDLLIFPSLAAIHEDHNIPSSLITEVMVRQGVEIQELDI